MAASTSREQAPRAASGLRRSVFHKLFKQSGLHSRYAETSFGRMHYYDSAPGSGERPVVLVHGVGSSSFTLVPLATLLRVGRRVVLPDLFHFAGFSEPVLDGREMLDTRGHVEALVEMLGALDGPPVDLCGHSMGGGLGIYAALRAPDRVRSLALLNPGGFTYGFRELDARLRTLDLASADALYEAAVAGTRLSRSRPARFVGRRLAMGTLGNARVRAYMDTIAPHECLDDKVKDVRCPTLLVWGREDRFLSSLIAEHVASEVSGVLGYWLDGCAHMLPMEAPYTLFRMLTLFWEERCHEPRALPSWLDAVLPRPSLRPIERRAATRVDPEAA